VSREGHWGNSTSPCLDKGLSALLTDLRDRGLLERSLVVVMGEFGWTPKINQPGGPKLVRHIRAMG